MKDKVVKDENWCLRVKSDSKGVFVEMETSLLLGVIAVLYLLIVPASQVRLLKIVPIICATTASDPSSMQIALPSISIASCNEFQSISRDIIRRSHRIFSLKQIRGFLIITSRCFSMRTAFAGWIFIICGENTSETDLSERERIKCRAAVRLVGHEGELGVEELQEQWWYQLYSSSE